MNKYSVLSDRLFCCTRDFFIEFGVSPCVMRKKHRRNCISFYSRFFSFFFKIRHVLQAQILCSFYIFEKSSRTLSRLTTEYDNVQQRVAHKSVCAVNTAGGFSCYKQIRNICKTIFVYFNAAVLIVQGRINQNRLFSYIDSVFYKHIIHCRNSF